MLWIAVAMIVGGALYAVFMLGFLPFDYSIPLSEDLAFPTVVIALLIAGAGLIWLTDQLLR